MKFPLLVLAFSTLHLQAQLTSANYTIDPATVDGGGGAATSANHQITAATIGGIYGIATSANFQTTSGYTPRISREVKIDLFDYDSWKTQYFTQDAPNQARSDDADKDGVSNEDEFFALTDPTDRSSRLTIKIAADGPGWDITFSPKASTSLRQYQLFRDNTLTTFSSLVPVDVLADGISGIFNNVPHFGAKELFRIKITLADQP